MASCSIRSAHAAPSGGLPTGRLKEEVAERSGIDVIADLGNCWMERDYEATMSVRVIA